MDRPQPYKINTLIKNGYVINIYARPWRYKNSKEVYAAVICSPAGYLKGTIRWSSSLADTILLASKKAYS